MISRSGSFVSHEGSGSRKVVGVSEIKAKKANKTESAARKQRYFFRKWVISGL